MSCTLGNEFPRIVTIITSLLEEKEDGGWVTFSYNAMLSVEGVCRSGLVVDLYS
jgi:hypothetical protein